MTLVFGHAPSDRALGVDGIEVDVRRTVDDHLVIVHDHEIPGRIAIAEAMRHDLPWDIPDLDELLDDCRGMTVNLEIKNFPRDPAWDPAQRVTKLTLDLLERRGTDDVLLSCFDLAAIDLAAARGHRTAALQLSRRPAAELLDAVVGHGHAIVHPYVSMVDAAYLDAARARGLTVNAWGDDRFDELVALGVDGIITERVADALAAVRSRP